MAPQELYENIYGQPKSFSFGKNWLRFLQTLTPARIEEAKKSLRESFPNIPLRGKSFIDIGSGSGLFSLAAVLMGARVVSVDADIHSVRSTKQVKKMFGPMDTPWEIHQGSILDQPFVDRLGTFDIVYAWGVLHHTGDMRRAIDSASHMVKPRGYFYIAIYNHSTSILEGTSLFWRRVKYLYNHSPRLIQVLIYQVYLTYLWVGLAVTGKNPIRYIREYPSARGMDFYSDIRDWIGGYPYEFASVEQIRGLVSKLGFELINIKKVRTIGCNEFLLRKKINN